MPADPPRPAWPIPASDADFVPIGPWNTDGMIVANPLHSSVRSRYLQSVITTGHPLLFIGSGEHGPTIGADNAGGIHEAMQHLVQHGHQRIAFIAGSPQDMEGDTGDRLRAYFAARETYKLEFDQRLVAYGRHTFGGGYAAMRQIIDSRVLFTAILASNDESALGAMQALRESGRSIPYDVAIIGFDDRPESAAQEPPLSSVRVPLFNIGYRAVELILQQIRGQRELTEPMKVMARLIARDSCGCVRKKAFSNGLDTSELLPLSPSADPAVQGAQLAQMMAAAVLNQAQGLADDECQTFCKRLVDAFAASLEHHDRAEFQGTLENVLRTTGAVGDDAHIWQAAMSILGEERAVFWQSSSLANSESLIDEMLDQARLAISAQMQRQHRQYVVDQRWTTNRLSLLTAQLLAALDKKQVFDSLARQLPEMGIHLALLGLFEAEGDDPLAWTTLQTLLTPSQPPIRLRSREFPPDELLVENRPLNLALIPLVNQSGQLGFVVFGTEYLDLYGVIVQQLAGALNTAQLYREATEGRRLAEEANLLKSRFLSTVSHELRTPLNLIVGLSGLLMQESSRSSAKSRETSRKDVERIHAQAQHLSGLIGDVLDLASSDAGQLRLTNELVDLGQALRLVAETGRQLAADKGLAWHAVLPESGPWVWGDRTRLRQVALNLINNAIKFTAHGEISLSLDPDGDSATVTVHDTGLGIPPDEQYAIFDEFRQSERSIARGYGGMGLGLAICKRLVEMHGGTIRVQSTGEEGAGSAFSFTLPTVQPPTLQQSQPTNTPLLDEKGEKNVLLLTTPAGTSEQLRHHLIERGFHVQITLMQETFSWQSRLAVSPPDAVVLDVSAASDEVWGILRATMGHPAMQGVPVLFYALSQENGSVLELDYLTKPVRWDELKRALDQHWSATEGVAPLRTFLVVDDDPNTLEMYERIVLSRSPSNRVLKANNGREALDILGQTRVDLVLLDLMMPEVDGFGVLEAMREQDSTSDVPVIVLTGRVLTEADMERLNRGVTTVLSKGLFSVEETLAHVGAALEHKRKLSSATQRLVRQAMAYLHEHYAEPISRQDIAQHVGMSEDYLTACFRQELGMPPVAYLNRYRVNQARRLLKDSEQNITQIALQVGFSDSGYFSRVFHRETGMSPEAYRRT